MRELGLSGRNVDSIAGNIRAEIQSFEYPDEYFRASSERRSEIIREASIAVGVESVRGHLERFVGFTQAARVREEEAVFQREVDDIVRRLNAGRHAAARLGTSEN